MVSPATKTAWFSAREAGHLLETNYRIQPGCRMGSDYELATPPISASGNERYRAFGYAAHLHRAELPHA
jgi:hypothetical protein